MVAVGLFVAVAFIVTSVFLTLADANRKAQNVRLVMDNLNFAIDSMALKMREGSNYQTNGDGDMSFARLEGGQNVYYTYGLTDKEEIASCKGQSAFSCSLDKPITAPQITVTNFEVKMSQASSKRATILIQGTAGSGKTKTTFNIQTTVSERN